MTMLSVRHVSERKWRVIQVREAPLVDSNGKGVDPRLSRCLGDPGCQGTNKIVDGKA